MKKHENQSHQKNGQQHGQKSAHNQNQSHQGEKSAHKQDDKYSHNGGKKSGHYGDTKDDACCGSSFKKSCGSCK